MSQRNTVLAQFLLSHRQKMHKTQLEVSKEIGVNQSVYCKWEKGYTQ